jgi:hypothetical protein
MQQIVFISNETVSTAGTFVAGADTIITEGDLVDVLEKVTDTSGNTIFVINVHCVFQIGERDNKRQIKLQEQGGVIIYRHLLNKFKNSPSNLKVVFYSPISAEHLVSLNPENYVLSLLPFIELFPRKLDGNFLEDWNFEASLRAKIEENNFLQFNNASENLLGGWALAGAKRIDLKGRKLLVIDDEWRQWKAVCETILDGSIDYFLKDEASIRAEFKKLNSGTFSNIRKGTLSQYDLIISDLYLWESHETDRWKTEDFINSISGFLLLKLIRDFEPAIPIIFQSTSTKFRIFETLSALGADGQIPKNNSCKANYKDKKDTFKLFEQVIVSSVENYGSCWLNEFYRYITNNNTLSNNLWRRRTDSIKKEIIELIKHAILGYKNLKINKKEYLDTYFSGKEIDPVSIPAGSILSVLGKVQEVLNSNNPELLFLSYLRNQASHDKNYHLFRLDDVKISLALLFKTLKAKPPHLISGGQGFKIPKGSKTQEFKFAHQVFYYLHYYINWNAFIPDELKVTFRDRLLYFIDKYYLEEWVKFEEHIKTKIVNEIHNIQIDSSLSSNFKPDTIGSELIIKFKK